MAAGPAGNKAFYIYIYILCLLVNLEQKVSISIYLTKNSDVAVEVAVNPIIYSSILKTIS